MSLPARASAAGFVGLLLLCLAQAGLAAQSFRVSLLSNLTPQMIGGGVGRANDVVGYVSPAGIEYAILGFDRGFALIDLRVPEEPQVISTIPAPSAVWGDAATFGQFAYLVKDYPPNQVGEGVYVVDLTHADQGVVELAGHLNADGLTKAHNLRVNRESGTLYVCGANTHGLMMFDLADPADPRYLGSWDEAYVHDAHIVSYPDEGPYAGAEIGFLACGGQGMFIVDLTEKGAPRTLAQLTYEGLAYCHQLWVSDDRRHAFVGDELDELAGNQPQGPTTFVVDITDLASPRVDRRFHGEVASIDHNMWGRWGYLFQANYTSGLRVYDLHDLENITEAAFYDTYPADDHRGFHGAWGVYADLPSGVILVSDIETGLYVFDCSEATGVALEPWEDSATLSYGAGAFPNPARGETEIRFRLPRTTRAALRIFDVGGHLIETLVEGEMRGGRHRTDWEPADLPTGVYFARLESDLGTHVARVILIR